MSVGDFPTPMARETYMPEDGLETTRSAPASDHHQYAQLDLSPMFVVPKGIDPVVRYREESLDESAYEPAEIRLDPFPTGADSIILRWMIRSIEQNPAHAQLTLDAALESAEKAGLSQKAAQEIARQAIAQFAHEHGRF